jgi:hypothetical protein
VILPKKLERQEKEELVVVVVVGGGGEQQQEEKTMAVVAVVEDDTSGFDFVVVVVELDVDIEDFVVVAEALLNIVVADNEEFHDFDRTGSFEVAAVVVDKDIQFRTTELAAAAVVVVGIEEFVGVAAGDFGSDHYYYYY